MTPVRALIAGFLAAVLLGAGLFIAASFAGGRPHDLLPLLSPARTPFQLWCFLGAWGALVAGGLGVFSAFLAFIAPEEEDDPRFRRRGFPKGLPIALIALALFLAWFALRCAARDETPVAVPLPPAETITAPPVAEVQPVASAAKPVAPPPLAEAASFQWRYMDPLMRDAGGVWTNSGDPFGDDAETERLLCGKAWAAVSGSASEEGPAGRNEARARLRTLRAMARANRWLDARPDCGPTIVFGLDLGQHVSMAGGADGAASAYQRQILVISRARGADEPALNAAAAESELRTFLAQAENRAALFDGRRFLREPLILSP